MQGPHISVLLQLYLNPVWKPFKTDPVHSDFPICYPDQTPINIIFINSFHNILLSESIYPNTFL